jgi:hypothetical protein
VEPVSIIVNHGPTIAVAAIERWLLERGIYTMHEALLLEAVYVIVAALYYTLTTIYYTDF